MSVWSDLPTAKNVDAEIERIKNIQWFKPMKVIPKKKAETAVKLACKLFGIEASVEYKTLSDTSDWDAARGAAWNAAWNAARGAAWNAAWGAAWNAARGAAWNAAWGAARGAARDAGTEIVMDLEAFTKKYPKNPFKVLMDLWEMGFYVCGVVDGKFILYYVPKKP